MKRTVAILFTLGFVAAAAGCAQKAPESSPATATDTVAAAPAPVLLTKSLYDDGPRASASPVDAALAAAGEKLFQTRGCKVCHGYGKKLTGPDLKGVTLRRTAAWMENQIMHPDVMTRTDPISHQLMVQNANVQMLNLRLTQAEAQSLIQYFKKLDAGK